MVLEFERHRLGNRRRQPGASADADGRFAGRRARSPGSGGSRRCGGSGLTVMRQHREWALTLKVPRDASEGMRGRREAVAGVGVHGALALLLLSRFSTILSLSRFIAQN